MQYISTRGQAPAIGFNDALLAGLASDGGLYVPKTMPHWSAEEFAACFSQPFHMVAAKVLNSFTGGDIPQEVIAQICLNAQNRFAHAATTPLVQIAPDEFVLELFHGPTLAFKDVAMQIIGQLMAHVLQQRGRRASVIAATSGDTGSAAIEAFAGLPNVDVFILYPHNRVSDVQRRQMTTNPHANVRTLAVDGTFDDCQAIVKILFNNHTFRDEVGLTGVNSINWARIMSQVVYYITAGVALGAPARSISYIVPTGNFGDIYAGFVAKQMGLPIDQLVVATNQNDILARCLATGDYTPTVVVPTSSPSMDIQISSNFERLLFAAYDGDATPVRTAMHNLAQSGSFTVAPEALAYMRRFMQAYAASEAEVSTKIRETLAQCGTLIDPHTAVGLVAADKTGALTSPRVTLATAHPAKFPDAVERATGVRPSLPQRLGNLFEREERFEVLPGDYNAVRDYVLARAAR